MVARHARLAIHNGGFSPGILVAMAHVSHEELQTALADARQKVVVGGRYAHYKNPDKLYEVVDLGVIEADEGVAVLYRVANGATPAVIWVRPLSSFLDTVEYEGQRVPRFAKMG